MVSNTDKAILSFANVDQLKAVAATLGKETNTPVNKMISALAKLQGMNQKSYKESIQAQSGVHEINIELPDMLQGYENKLKSKIRIGQQVTFGFEGYETYTDESEYAELALIEHTNGSPCVRAWADRYKEDVTHSIEFGQAKSGKKASIPYIDLDFNLDSWASGFAIDGFLIKPIMLPRHKYESLFDVDIVIRTEEINEIEEMIGEEHQNIGSNPNAEENIHLLREALETLNASSEPFVLTYYDNYADYITPEKDRETYIAKLNELRQIAKSMVQDKVVVRAKAVVAEDKLDSDDKNVAGIYIVDELRDADVQIGHEANAAIDALHAVFPVASPDDFAFEVFNADMSKKIEKCDAIESGFYRNYSINVELPYKE